MRIEFSGEISYRIQGKKHRLPFSQRGAWDENIRIRGEGLDIFLETQSEIEVLKAEMKLPCSFLASTRVLVNGYQSWSHSRQYSVFEKRLPLRKMFRPLYQKFLLQNYGDESFVRYSKKRGYFHSWSFLELSDGGDAIRLFGSLSEAEGFTLFRTFPEENAVFVQKEVKGMRISGTTRIFSLIFVSKKRNEAYDAWFEAMKIQRPKATPKTGYTSWYNHYEKISEETVLSDLKGFSDHEIPIDVFQIDDGYQKAVGDWLSVNEKFPRGMKPLADEIHALGMKAGLWLAPFICEEKSDLMKEHPDWIVRDKKGKAVAIGNNPFNWSGFYYALRFEKPEVKSYLKKVFNTVLRTWGFDLVKLDFLHAACFTPRGGKNRGQLMALAMHLLREYVGEKEILGCGMPLGAGFGLVDYCRVGSDVALSWEDKRLQFLAYKERISTFNSLMSTVARRSLDGRAFLNDPDVFILRDENTSLSSDHKKTLFTLNCLFGSLVFMSDNLNSYSDETMSLYQKQFPRKPRRILKTEFEKEKLFAEFSIEDLNYLLISNFSDQNSVFYLSEGHYFAAGIGVFTGDKEVNLPAFSTLVLLKISRQSPCIAGSRGHLFPGSDVDEFHYSDGSLTLKRSSLALKASEVLIRVPDGMQSLEVNGKRFEVHRCEGLSIVSLVEHGTGMVKK